MKISNTMKIKQQDGSFEDVKISYIEPKYCTAEGYKTKTSGNGAHAEGYASGPGAIGPQALADGAHAEGYTSGQNVKAPMALGKGSHAEGYGSVIATGDGAHAEGYDSVTNSGKGAHVEGYKNIGNGNGAHAEGYNNIINNSLGGSANHVEGLDNTIDDGDASFAQASHVGGIGNICKGASAQTIIGKYNIIDKGDYDKRYGTYAHIVGNGTSDTDRSNAYTLDWDGNAVFAGDIKDGKGNILDNTQKQADKAYALAEKKVSGISNSIITGSYVYDGSATDKFSFEDENVRGKSFIICGTQDAGNPVLRAYISGNTITIDVSSEITNMRVNYICF